MQLPERAREVIEGLDQTRGLFYNVGRPTAELLYVFAKLLRPKRVVEVGTANGYSSIILGSAVKDIGGSVITIERNGRMAENAQKNIFSAGLQDVVTVLPGSAYKILDRLSGPFGMVFLDATKQEYLGYFERVKNKISPNGLLIADNVVSHEQELGDFMREVSGDNNFSSSILPFGSGLMIATRNPVKEPVEKKHISDMGELVKQIGPRIFQGTARDVQNGKIFLKNLYDKTNNDIHLKQESADDLDGYEEALFEEESKLPEL
ncbi:MAG: class I SAM-dependent methyltransferase [bacterium]|nr:class I SAM-dependent methyltransferase [bacterium]